MTRILRPAGQEHVRILNGFPALSSGRRLSPRDVPVFLRLTCPPASRFGEPRSRDVPQAATLRCRGSSCGADADSPDETTCGNGRALPRTPRRALSQSLTARRSGQCRPSAASVQQIPASSGSLRSRFAGTSMCGALAWRAALRASGSPLPARRRIGAVCGGLRCQRSRAGPRRIRVARRTLRPRHERAAAGLSVGLRLRSVSPESSGSGY